MNHLWNVIQDNVDSLAKQIGLNSLALANEDGLVIAACGPVSDVEMMAAVSPLHRQGDALVTLYQEELQLQGLGLNVIDAQCDGQSLFLCATGASSQINHPELQNLLQKAVKALR